LSTTIGSMGPMMVRVEWPQRFIRPCRGSEATQAESASLSPSSTRAFIILILYFRTLLSLFLPFCDDNSENHEVYRFMLETKHTDYNFCMHAICDANGWI